MSLIYIILIKMSFRWKSWNGDILWFKWFGKKQQVFKWMEIIRNRHWLMSGVIITTKINCSLCTALPNFHACMHGWYHIYHLKWKFWMNTFYSFIYWTYSRIAIDVMWSPAAKHIYSIYRVPKNSTILEFLIISKYLPCQWRSRSVQLS